MVNWKTTLAGAVPAVAVLLKTFGLIDLTPEQITAIITIGILVASILAKDNDVTGGTKPNAK